MRLSAACTILSGYTLRGSLEPAAHGVLTIHPRDFTPEEGIDPASLSRANLEDAPRYLFVQSGDVLFRTRGERNLALALDDRFREPALALLPLMILRPDTARIAPEYLAWAVNQPPAQRHFNAAARGTSIRMVPKSALETLEIDLPSLADQRLIAATADLAARERRLAMEIADRRFRVIERSLSRRSKTLSQADRKKDHH